MISDEVETISLQIFYIEIRQIEIATTHASMIYKVLRNCSIQKL